MDKEGKYWTFYSITVPVQMYSIFHLRVNGTGTTVDK